MTQERMDHCILELNYAAHCVKETEIADPDDVEFIHRWAVKHYQEEEGIRQRAEEIYHRLMLQQEFDVIDEQWMTGVEFFCWMRFKSCREINN